MSQTQKPELPAAPVAIPNPGTGPERPTAPVMMPVATLNRNQMDPDMLTLRHQQPGIHYRWVRSRRDEGHSAVEKAKLKGYSIVKRTPGGVESVVESDNRGDGTITVGDLILMQCPEHLALRRAKTKTEKTASYLASTTAETEQMAKEKGVKLISDADHGTNKEVR